MENVTEKIKVTEATFEKLVDDRVMRALRSDPRYVHAADAEEQAQAEEEISDEIHAALSERYEVV